MFDRSTILVAALVFLSIATGLILYYMQKNTSHACCHRHHHDHTHMHH